MRAKGKTTYFEDLLQYVERRAMYDEPYGFRIHTKVSNRGTPVGNIWGSLDSHGYLVVKINKIKHYIHHLVYLWHQGELVKEQIDHINGVKTDNRIVNLRAVLPRINAKNNSIRSDNTSGITGVSFNKESKKWDPYVCVEGKIIHLGQRATLEEAAQVRKLYLETHPEFGFTLRHGT